MNDPSEVEVRLRNVEGFILWLKRLLRDTGQVARSAAEASGMPAMGGFGGGLQIFRAIVTVAIPAPANATAAATSTGRATIQLRDPNTLIYATHPLFPTAQVILNDWPGSTTTATAGKVIKVTYDGQNFTLLIEAC